MIEYQVKVYSDGTKYWYINGKFHREDGPACEYADGNKKWFINGKELTEQEFNARNETKEMSIEELQDILGHKIKIKE